MVGARIPEFLSDHPEPMARVEEVRRQAQEVGCGTTLGDQLSWNAFKASLPEPTKNADVEEKASEEQ
jgi:hypothetical protein